MSDKIIARDTASGLALTRSAHDPPRYYLRLRGRRDLVSIGDPAAAVEEFLRQAQRLHQYRLRAQDAVGGATETMERRAPPPSPRAERAQHG